MGPYGFKKISDGQEFLYWFVRISTSVMVHDCVTVSLWPLLSRMETPIGSSRAPQRQLAVVLIDWRFVAIYWSQWIFARSAPAIRFYVLFWNSSYWTDSEFTEHPKVLCDCQLSFRRLCRRFDLSFWFSKFGIAGSCCKRKHQNPADLCHDIRIPSCFLWNRCTNRSLLLGAVLWRSHMPCNTCAFAVCFSFELVLPRLVPHPQRDELRSRLVIPGMLPVGRESW